MRLVNWIMAGCFFTASFDILLIFNFAGNLRFSQLLLGVVCVAAAARVVQDGRVLWPRGGTAIMLWLFSQLLFLPLGGIFVIALQFFGLLAFTLTGIFAVLQLYGRSNMVGILMRLYLWSFVFVAVFGMVQFILPILHLPGPLVQQWQQTQRVARINGFSYEPSYFATYMMMGWVMAVDLRISGAQITAGRGWKWITVMLTVVMILCTSKTAWLILMVELAARVLPPAVRGMRNTFRRLRQGLVLIRIPHQYIVLNVGAVLLIVAIVGWFVLTHIDPWSLLQGTGLGGTAAHSYNDRTSRAIDTWNTFLEHPFVGRTLGGVPVAVGEHLGIPVRTMDDVRQYWGFPVFLDVLTASGIFGFLPFAYFMWVNTVGAMRLAKHYWPSEEARWLRALARGMIFECLMLMADQNILRVYVWLQLTMVTVVAYHMEFGREPVIEREEALPLGAPQPVAGGAA